MTAPIMMTQSLPILAPGPDNRSRLDAGVHGPQVEERQGRVAGFGLDEPGRDLLPALRQPGPDGLVIADEDPERPLAEDLESGAVEVARPEPPLDPGRKMV